MRWNTSLAGVCAVIATSLMAAAAQERELPRGVREFAWAPPAGMSPEEASAAAQGCNTVAFQARENVGVTIDPVTTAMYGVMGATFGSGIQRAQAQEIAYDGALAHCQNDIGFIQVGLTRREYQQWRAAGISARRHAFLAEILSAHPERAISPAVLPPRPREMATVGGSDQKPPLAPAITTESEAVTTQAAATESEAVASEAATEISAPAEPVMVEPAGAEAAPEETAPSQ
jgi:hypothetical protein